VTSPVVIPDTPSTTPAWLVRAIALLVALTGPAIAWVDPTGKINTAAAQEVVVLAFLAAALVIFVFHLGVTELHRYGLSRAALVGIESGVVSEAKAMLPAMQSAYQVAAPVLNTLPGVAKIEGRLTQAESAIKGVVDSAAAQQANAAVETAFPAVSALERLFAGKSVSTSTGLVDVPPLPATPAPAEIAPTPAG
jgi:hypothetical protein